MTRDDCIAIMKNLPVIQAIAEGKSVYFAAFNCEGKFIGWRETDKVGLTQIRSSGYSVKPRYQCIKPGKYKPIPYEHQRARYER